MRILAIETSCDETAISILEAKGKLDYPEFSSLSDVILSQIDIHSQYGGVFPALAKREHSKNIVPLLEKAFSDAKILTKKEEISEDSKKKLSELFSHEEGLTEKIIEFLEKNGSPDIDTIAVTYGPGLEPALWVGINVAKALSTAWNKPLVPVNHMEGHFASVLFDKAKNKQNSPPELPALALIISGGHTEFIDIKKWGDYKYLGGTLDDAVGEAFDKVARMLDLPYPGGPPLSKLAKKSRQEGKENPFVLPRPMKNSGDLNLSFSGLKTAVLYTVKKETEINEEKKSFIARAFEDAVADVLIDKTKKALEKESRRTLIVCGGVSANSFLRQEFLKFGESFGIPVLFPESSLSTDNACMIAVAAFLVLETRENKILEGEKEILELRAEGNKRIE